MALGLTLAGPVAGVAQSASAQGWGRPGWHDPRWGGSRGHDRGWGYNRGWDGRHGWDRRRRDDTGLIVGLGALAAVAVVAAAASSAERDRQRRGTDGGFDRPLDRPLDRDFNRYDDPVYRDRASADCERAAVADARDRMGEPQRGRVDDVRRVGGGFSVRGSVDVVSAGRDDGFDDYDRYARPRSVPFTCRWDGQVRDLRLEPAYAYGY